jgi:Heterokaryon incompatibility protein (HET)
MFKLETNNLDLLCHEVPAAKLCKTFRDAIKATIALGFNYLWIDSLCIIQDSEDDWAQESVRMSAVYGNAVVNISATNSKDGNGGLFCGRDVLKSTNPAFQTREGRIYGILDHRQFERCVTSSPLSDRAWSFQERYLAQRTIHFGAEQIFCQCSKETASECWPEGRPSAPSNLLRVTGNLQDARVLFPRSWEWSAIVSAYSKAQLTFAKDKLIALSGVATYFRELAGGDQYVAGMWRRNLERQLCWRTTPLWPEPAKDKPIACNYRAPSWSWASSDHPIDWRLHTIGNALDPKPNQNCLLRIMDVDLRTKSDNPQGPLQDAMLHIWGALLPASIESVEHGGYGGIIIHSMNKGPINTIGKVYYDEEEANNDEIEYLLPMFEDFDEMKDSHPELCNLRLWGLVLNIAKGRGKGHFKRLGVFNFLVYLDKFEQLRRLFHQEEHRPSQTPELFSREKELLLTGESILGEAVSEEEMEGCNLTETYTLKGIQLYNITLV